MVAKLKRKLIPKDYQVNLFGELQNLKHKFMRVKEYIKELYKLNIRFGHIKEYVEKMYGYTNGLIFDMKDEVIFLQLKTLEDAY